jgi:tryptophan synthase alpha chain
MSRYETMFANLREQNQGAFIPFVTIGDPDLDTSFDIICALIEAGADALELGIPFSDPIADGPTIQAANIRALDQDISTQKCLDLIAKVRALHPTVPIGLLLYSNLVVAKGIEHFYQLAKSAGVDSVLVADVPIRESAPFRKAAELAGVDPVFIVPPTLTEHTLQDVAKFSKGYVYLLSRAGVTGAETKANMPASMVIDRLSKYESAPAILGFGISAPNQVSDAIVSGAAGAISGSAVVNIIEQNLNDRDAMLASLHQFVSSMKAATSNSK